MPVSLLKGKLFRYADDIALVNIDDNWVKLKQNFKINLKLF